MLRDIFLFTFVLHSKVFNKLSRGVRKLFSKGGQIFEGGAKTYYLPPKNPKRYYFRQKSAKTYYFVGQGGQGPPLALPCGRPCKLYICNMKFEDFEAIANTVYIVAFLILISLYAD
jgi:hypothetical protein